MSFKISESKHTLFQSNGMDKGTLHATVLNPLAKNIEKMGKMVSLRPNEVMEKAVTFLNSIHDTISGIANGTVSNTASNQSFKSMFKNTVATPSAADTSPIDENKSDTRFTR